MAQSTELPSGKVEQQQVRIVLHCSCCIRPVCCEMSDLLGVAFKQVPSSKTGLSELDQGVKVRCCNLQAAMSSQNDA